MKLVTASWLGHPSERAINCGAAQRSGSTARDANEGFTVVALCARGCGDCHRVRCQSLELPEPGALSTAFLAPGPGLAVLRFDLLAVRTVVVIMVDVSVRGA